MIYDAIDSSIKKKDAEKQAQIEKQKKEEEERKKQEEKKARINELISIYDKGLTKDIVKENYKDFDLYIEEIRNIDKTKAENIDIHLCNDTNVFDACYRSMKVYAINKRNKEAEEIFDKLLSWCIFDGYGRTCDLISTIVTYNIKQSGRFTLYEDTFLKAYVEFEKNSDNIYLEFLYITNKISMHIMKGGMWNGDGVTCFTGFESALNANGKFEEYYTRKCMLYPSLEGELMPFNASWDVKSSIKANKNNIYIEVPRHSILTDFGAMDYQGYTMQIPQKTAKKIYDNYKELFNKNVEIIFKKRKQENK